MRDLTILLKIDWGLLCERPFVAEVWGTVSDWVMVIVTVVTARFLYVTFSEQRKANQISLKHLQLQIIPTLKVSETLTPVDDYPEIYSFKIISQNNPVFDIKIQFLDNRQDLNYNLKPNMGASEIQDIYYGRHQNPQFQFKPTRLIKVHFSDLDGNKYSQDISHIGKRLFISYPERVIK